MSLEKLIKSHLAPSDTLSNRRLISACAAYFIQEVPAYLVSEAGETFYELAYDRITEIVFNEEYSFKKSELDELKTMIEERIEKNLRISGVPSNLIKIMDGTTRRGEETSQDTCIKHIKACYRKFVGHISLAVIQKNFILKTANKATEISNQAKEAANEALKNSQSILTKVGEASERAEDALGSANQATIQVQDALEDAKKASETSAIAVQSANAIAEKVSTALINADNASNASNHALEQAKLARSEAENTSKNMTTQFVTILGIFASIIVALFGGMSLIRATVELLQNNGNLLVLVFVTSILLLSFSLLIILLTSWISSLNSKVETRNYYVLRWMTLIILTIVAVVCGGLIHDNPINTSDTNKSQFELEIKTKGSD
ncbi:MULTISPECIES: hypothetical protein [Acinetobacter]|uniref:hypothetical protein n=1 Tax=Acinetobacter TaxID=469 RepID=UPI00257807C0|nr:hypothetical protein [Acinetobacter indicus]MDM1771572.1 hypothetical protein [Acinetobacter indicus]MDM1774370.1 hypothetical protein [Acinetobacter indicus]